MKTFGWFVVGGLAALSLCTAVNSGAQNAPAAKAAPDVSAKAASAPLILDGLDPVLLAQGKEVAGKEAFGLTFRKHLYLFADEKNRTLFQQKPALYAVQLEGHCAMMLSVSGRPDLFHVYKNHIYLFGSENCKASFVAAPERCLQRASGIKKVGILIFEGVQIIDYTGPYEVLGQAGCMVSTVAERPDPITTSMGMTVTPAYSFADAPKFDILVLPGGNVNSHLDNSRVMQWVKERVGQAEYTLSVCNGAFFLGKAGLLDGLTATTFHGLIDALKTLAPKCKVVIDRRFVDNGKIITTAGLSSGIDGALHVVERMHGRIEAQQVALGMEYNWQPDLNYARAALADRHLYKVIGRGFDTPDEWAAKVIGYSGDRNTWTKKWEITTTASPKELFKIMDDKLNSSDWKRVKEAPSAAGETAQSLWQFKDEEGQSWRGKLTVQPMPDARGKLLASLHIERVTSK